MIIQIKRGFAEKEVKENKFLVRVFCPGNVITYIVDDVEIDGLPVYPEEITEIVLEATWLAILKTKDKTEADISRYTYFINAGGEDE